jgi:hypothetical protein
MQPESAAKIEEECDNSPRNPRLTSPAFGASISTLSRRLILARASSQAAFGDVEAVLTQIGQMLGQALIAGFQSQLSRPGAARPAATAPALPARRGPGRPPRSAAEAACIVPGCQRRSVAKKLCPTHYRKAGHLNMSGTLTEAQLALLARDGRAVRWEKAAKAKTPAKVAKQAKTAPKQAKTAPKAPKKSAKPAKKSAEPAKKSK